MPGANRDQTGSDPRSLSCCGTPHFFPQSVARWAASPSWWVSLVTPDGRQPRHASETGSGVRTPCVSSCELRPSPPCPASVDHSPLLASRTHSPGSMPPPCFPPPVFTLPGAPSSAPYPHPRQFGRELVQVLGFAPHTSVPSTLSAQQSRWECKSQRTPPSGIS